MDDHCLQNEQPLCLLAGEDGPHRGHPVHSFCSEPRGQEGWPPCIVNGSLCARARAGPGSPLPERARAGGMARQPVKSLFRTLVMHVCLMMLAMTNITSGILIANEHYDRLPGPLLLSLLFSICCAVFQDTAER